MKKIKFYILVVAFSLIGFIIFFYKIFGVIQPTQEASPDNINQSKTLQDPISQNITLRVVYENGKTTEFAEPFKDKANALSILEDFSDENGISLDTQQYDFGVFVKSIDGFESSTEMSWIYFVNGESGSVAADNYTLNPGDVVEWKYLPPTDEE
jgi:hypothetical protein